MGIKSFMKNALGVVNSTLGVPCQYDGIQDPIMVILDKNVEVRDSIGAIAGYKVQARINKTDVPDLRMHQQFTDDEGTKYSISFIAKETHAAWYCDVTPIQ